MLALGQAFDFDRLETQVGRMPADLADQRVEMLARAHQHGDAAVRVGAPGVADQLERDARFVAGAVAAVTDDDRMHADAAVGNRRLGRRRFGVAHGPGGRFVARREDRRESRIHPIDDAGMRAVVAIQAQVFEAQIADAVLAHIQEQTDISLAKTVDRLHRIADDEQRPAVVRHPPAHQLLQQRHLTRAGVLELVDQQVTDAVIERLRQIGRRFVVAQRQPGAGGDFDEIDLAGFLEGQPQLPGGQPQQAREVFHGRPLGIAQCWRRQAGQLAQRAFQPGNAGQVCDQFGHRLLLLGEFLAGREADVLVQRLAESPFAGQQQPGQLPPRRHVRDIAVQRFAPVEQQIEAARHVDRSKADQRHQPRLPAGIEQPSEMRQIAFDQRRETGLDLVAHDATVDPCGMLQPLVAPAEHGDQQAFQPAGVVIHEGQRRSDNLAVRRLRLDHFQRMPGGRRVVRLGVVGNPGLRAEARQEGHLPGQAGAQRIQRGDAQAARMRQQTPALVGIARQHGERPFAGFLLVFRQFAGWSGRRFEAAEDAVAHLGRCLVGEGQRQHFFRVIDGGQQAQRALRQQFRLAGAGRRFDDEGSKIKRPLAAGFVFLQAVDRKNPRHFNAFPAGAGSSSGSAPGHRPCVAARACRRAGQPAVRPSPDVPPPHPGTARKAARARFGRPARTRAGQVGACRDGGQPPPGSRPDCLTRKSGSLPNRPEHRATPTSVSLQLKPSRRQATALSLVPRA